jgi:hypothetical protein
MDGAPPAPLLSLGAIEGRVRRVAERLSGAGAYLPTFEQSRHDGSPHIEVGDGYFFVVCERGSELERRKTLELDELLFWVFSSIAFSLASRWELDNRRRDEDSRRQVFAKQVDLLSALSPEWARREAEAHRRILLEHPFSDV